MGYNKRQFQKTNDKKVLHKVRKHWVVVSLAMLMALGGGALATHVSANADSTTANNGSNNGDLASRLNQNMNQSKSTLVSASAQSNNNTNASAQSASANNTNASAQSSVNSGVSASQNNAVNNNGQNNNVNNNQSSISDSSLMNRASLLHQRILENASQPRNLQATGVRNQNNSILGQNNSNNNAAPKRLLGDDNSDSSNNVINWLDDSNGSDVIASQPQNFSAGSPLSRATLEGWQRDFEGANKYEYDSARGMTFNGNPNMPSTFQSGNNTIDIYVKPIPSNAARITINYENVSDGNASVGQKSYSDSDGQMFTNLPNDEKFVPTGYSPDTQVGNQGVISADGLNLSNPSSIMFVRGDHTINVAVTPNSTSSNYENVIYEDDQDNNAQVGESQFTGKQNSDIPFNTTYHAEHYTPTGYDFDQNAQASVQNSSKFQRGSNYIVMVRPNGITPTRPGNEPGYSTATIDFVDGSNSDSPISSEQILGKNSDHFNIQNQVGSNTLPIPAGWKLSSGTTQAINHMGGNNASDMYSNHPSAEVVLKPITGYHATTVPYNIIYEDENNGNAIIGNPLTEHGKAGTPIDYAQFTTMLPSDSTFAGFGTHDANVEPNANNVILVKHYNTSNPGNITVKYVDGRGHTVTKTIPGNSVNYGSDIDVTKYVNKNGQNKNTVPSDFTPSDGQNTKVKVDSDTHTVTVRVNGKVMSPAPTAKILPVEEYYEGGHKQFKSDTNDIKTVPLTGIRYDGSKTVNLSDYKPTTNLGSDAYLVDPADNNQISVDANGNVEGADNNGLIHMNYEQVAPVTVHFVDNDTGAVVSSASIKPDINEIKSNGDAAVDVTKGANQSSAAGSAIPQGYTKVNGQSPIAYARAEQPTVVNYMVEGNPVTVNYSVNRTTDNGHGAPNTLDSINKTAHTKVGDIINVDPTDPTIEPQGYNVDPTDHAQKLTVQPTSNSDQGSVTNPSFKYDGTSAVSDVTPIEIEYVNQSGTDVAHKEVTGYLGNSIKATSDLAMPTGYKLANPNENVEFTFNDAKNVQGSDANHTMSQLAKVNVLGDQVPNGTLHFNVLANELTDGNVTNHKSDNNLPLNNVRIGDRVPVSANDYNPDASGYVPTYSDANAYVTVDNDTTVTPSNGQQGQPLTLNYNAKQGFVKINYQDAQTNQSIGSPVNVSGTIDNPFNISNYTQNISDGNGQHYVATNVTPNNITKFTPNTQNVTVKAEKWDTATIKYVYKNGNNDTRNGQLVGKTTYSNNPVISANIPSNYFTNVPSGYKLSGTYNGSKALANTTYTVYVKSNHTNPDAEPSNISNLGTVNVHYVPYSDYDNGNNNANLSLLNADTFDLQKTMASDGTAFNSTTYTSPITAAGGTAVADPASPGAEYTKGQTKDYYIFCNPAQLPSTVNNTIQYLDVNNNNQPVGTLPITGPANSQINYSDYENVVPQGYSFDQLGNGAHSKFTSNNATDDILVREDKPETTYGTIRITYGTMNNGVFTRVPNTFDDVQDNETGAEYNAADAINTVPDGYTYSGIVGGSSAVPSYFPGPETPNSTDTVKVIVTPAKKAYTTYTINYKDANGNVVGTDTVTGKTGNLFNYSSYEDDMPNNYKYSSIVGGNLPSTFNGTDGTYTINVTSD